MGCINSELLFGKKYYYLWVKKNNRTDLSKYVSINMQIDHNGLCIERDFMMSLSDDKQAGAIDAFNTTSRYLDDILNINNVYFDNMVSQIYPSELQLNKANTSDTEAAFLNLRLSISNDIVSTKIYDKRDDFDFEIVNFPFLDGDFLALHPMEFISLNSFVLLENPAMLLTSTVLQ